MLWLLRDFVAESKHWNTNFKTGITCISILNVIYIYISGRRSDNISTDCIYGHLRKFPRIVTTI
jgi:hypothetical protein